MKPLLKYIMISLLFVACSGHRAKQTATLNESIETQANRMIKLLKEKDYPGFMNTLYPKYIENFGGKDKMLQFLNNTWGQLDKQSVMIDSVTFSKPNKIIDTGNELQTTIYETLKVHGPSGKMIIKSTVIAISSDNGESWYFIDSAGIDLKSMQKKLPNLNDSLIIAKRENPEIIPN